MWRRSLAWSPTIALSWLWGLGFFYAIHVTVLYGLPGFLAFALPNAIGLGLFGCILDRFGPSTGLRDAFERLAARYGGVLLAFQVTAVAITLFAFSADYLRPLIGGLVLPVALLLALVAAAMGHVLRVQDFKALHGVLLAVGVALALGALALMPDARTVPATLAAPGLPARFYGLIVPSLVGFLLGPWLDLQHWQRALRIREEGASITRAYAAGGLLFFCLIGLNAVIASGLPATGLHRSFDGIAEAPAALAAGFAAAGPAAAGAAWLFGLWAAIAVASTLDSSYAATRWFLVFATTRSKNPVFALLPKPLVQTPLWMLLAAGVAAGAAYGLNAPLLLLMAPYATLFIGYAACLLLQVSRARSGRHDSMLCFLLGTASAACFAIGYYARLVPVMALCPLLPLLAAIPVLAPRTAAAADRAEEAPEAPVAAAGPPRAAALVPDGAPRGGGPLIGWFDGNWFQYDVIPTYDDTNSVGNVYFANYVRWVGKTRELFFAKCVPNFDLKTTNFFILTRDFYHKFVRETREFEAILVRIRIGKHNRKFITLEHEILGADGGLLGKGTQQLMFVSAASYQLIDVPVDMLRGFLPYVVNAPAGY